LSGLIDALETQGLATILAEPTLSTTSGQAASFLAGGQFPVPVVQPSGSGTTYTIQYQPFGVSLKFTPVVMSHDRISLTVNPDVSTLDFSNPIQVSGITYPIIDTRQASAVVELGSGDSFMLAGLLQSDVSNTVNKFPGLGDLPVLGALFRSTQFQNNQTELVILVTPYIVHPVADGSKLQTPLDGYKPPSDLERLLLGNLYQQQPMKKDKDEKPAMPELHGAGGFILE
ncbi:MAG: type II and III secretion system protein family protein, partial [Pseudomonadota bacterium]|nr:type II and III secretion system protein family protein [Pseudomonadota bacterium]